jgi:hypothetical protein
MLIYTLANTRKTRARLAAMTISRPPLRFFQLKSQKTFAITCTQRLQNCFPEITIADGYNGYNRRRRRLTAVKNTYISYSDIAQNLVVSWSQVLEKSFEKEKCKSHCVSSGIALLRTTAGLIMWDPIFVPDCFSEKGHYFPKCSHFLSLL